MVAPPSASLPSQRNSLTPAFVAASEPSFLSPSHWLRSPSSSAAFSLASPRHFSLPSPRPSPRPSSASRPPSAPRRPPLLAPSRLILLAAAFHPSAAYSLFRADTPKARGLACIPVAASKVVAPGQRETMHIYDASSLQVIRHAQAHSDGIYGQVVIDEAAARERVFRVLEIGARVKVLSVRPSVHTDKFGGSSSSLLAEKEWLTWQVIGVGVIQPESVLSKMPFMTISCAREDSLLLPPADPPVDFAEVTASLHEAAALCETLDGVTNYKGPLSQASERSEGGWPLSSRVERVLELRGHKDVCEGAKLALQALASTAHLPGGKRLEAMELAQRRQLNELVKLVEESLRDEARRRLAIKSLAELGQVDDSSEDLDVIE